MRLESHIISLCQVTSQTQVVPTRSRMEDNRPPRTTSELSSKRKTTTWTTTEETTIRHDSLDRNRQPWPKFVMEYDDEV
jgi:hypothetical protein